MKLNQDDFKAKVGTWWTYLEPFFASEKAWNIYQTLKKDVKGGEKVTPKSEDSWKFLSEINPDQVKVIIIGLDAYPGLYSKDNYHSNGIPFDCSNSPDGKLQPSLNEFWNGLSAEYEEEFEKSPSLKYLLDQGVFLGNRGITCKMFKTGSHIPLWDDFWEVFFENFVSKRPDIPVIFLGQEALKLRKYVTFNRVFPLAHPSFAARSGQTWDTKGVFKQCNEIIKSLNGEDFCIKWDKKEYEKWLNEIPF